MILVILDKQYIVFGLISHTAAFFLSFIENILAGLSAVACLS